MIATLRDLWTHRGVLYAQAVADLRSSVIGTRLGYLWWLLDPLLLLGVYTFVVHGIFGRGGPGYPYFLFCGLVVWQWFSRSIGMAATAYTRNKGLILSLPVPLPIYVLAPILVHAFFALIGLLLLIALHDPLRVLAMPQIVGLMLLQVVLTFSIGLLLAALTVFVRDLAKFAEYGVRVLFYLSPVLYDVEQVTGSNAIPPWMKDVYLLNPFAHLLPAYRHAVLGTEYDMQWALPAMLALTVVMLALATYTTVRLRNRIPQAI